MDLRAVVLLSLLSVVRPHGRLVDPISRASLWRYGYGTPINYNDNELFCGGFQNQWETHNGKCGVCGDPWQGPKEYEAGGKYANRIISRMYEQGSVVTMVVDLSSNHLGYFEFRLCPHNNFSQPVAQSCLDKYLLRGIPSGIGRHMVLKNFKGNVEYEIKLPPTVTCGQCVIQWKYHAGNSWGNETDGRSCKGCGPQEEFYNCADVSILPPEKFRALLRANKDQLPNGSKRQRAFVGTEKPTEIITSTVVPSLKPGTGYNHRARQIKKPGTGNNHRARQFKKPVPTGKSGPIKSKHRDTLSELVHNVQSTGKLGEQGWFQYSAVYNSNPREPSETWGLNIVSRLTDNNYYPESFNFAPDSVRALPTWNAFNAESLPLSENQLQLRHQLRNLWPDRFVTDITPTMNYPEGSSFNSMFSRADIIEIPGPTAMNSFNSHGFQTMENLPPISLPPVLLPSVGPEHNAEYGDLRHGNALPVWDHATYPQYLQMRHDVLPLSGYQRLLQQWVK